MFLIRASCEGSSDTLRSERSMMSLCAHQTMDHLENLSGNNDSTTCRFN